MKLRGIPFGAINRYFKEYSRFHAFLFLFTPLAAITRFSISSFVYLLSFIASVLFTPHSALRHRERYVKVFTGVILVFSGLLCLTHIVFQSIASTSLGQHIHKDTTAGKVLLFFGFEKFSGINSLGVTPDIFVFVLSGFLFWMMERKKVFDHTHVTLGDAYRLPQVPVLNTYLILPVVFLSAVAFASLVNSVYFIVFSISLLLKLMGKNIWEINDIWYPWLYLYAIGDLILTYIYQIPLIHNTFSTVWAQDVLGLESWGQLSWDYASFVVVGEWSLSCALFLLYSYRHHVITVSKSIISGGIVLNDREELDVLTVPEKTANDSSPSSPLFTALGGTTTNPLNTPLLMGENIAAGIRNVVKSKFTYIDPQKYWEDVSNLDQSSKTVVLSTTSDDGTSRIRIPFKRPRMSPRIKKLFIYWGWPICLIALLVIAIFNPSITFWPILLVVFVGPLVRPSLLEKYKVIPVTTIYLLCIIFAQYVFQIIPDDVVKGCGNSCANVGLIKHKYFLITAGFECITATLMAFYWTMLSSASSVDHTTSLGYRLLGQSESEGEEEIDGLDVGKHEEEEVPHIIIDTIGDEEDETITRPQSTEDVEDDGKVKGKRKMTVITPVQSPTTTATTTPTTTPKSKSPTTPKSKSPTTATATPSPSLTPSPEHKQERGRGISSVSRMAYSAVRLGRQNRLTSYLSEKLNNYIDTNDFSTLRRGWRLFLLVLLRESFRASLLGLYFATLKTETYLFNAGYMVFFITFAISSQIARESWILLVIYCQFVISLQYGWQLSWTRWLEERFPGIIDNIGLVHSTYLPRTLFWHLFILVSSIIQWHVNKYASYHGHSESVSLVKSLPNWAKVVVAFISGLWENFGLFFCYLTLLLVPLSETQSFVDFVYYIFVLVCLVVHMKKRERASETIRLFWVVIVVFSGVTLISRYVFQFPYVENWVRSGFKRWVVSHYFTLENFGLVHWEGNDNSLFLGLLGNTIIFIFTVYELKVLWKPSSPSVKQKLYQTVRKVPTLHSMVEFVRRCIMLHVSKVTTIVILVVVLTPVSAIHFLLFIFLLTTFAMRHGTNYAGTPLLLYSWLVALMQMLFQYPGVQLLLGKNQRSLLLWAGLTYNEGVDGRHEVISYLLVSAFLLLQRYAIYWRRSWKHLELKRLRKAEEDRVKQNMIENGEHTVEELDVGSITPKKVKKPFLTLFLYEKDYSLATPMDHFKWLCSHCFSLFYDEIWIMVLLVAIYIRQLDILGVFYVILLSYSAFFKTNKRVSRIITVLYGTLLCFLLMIQYFFEPHLKLPPPYLDLNYPWEGWTPLGLDKWLLLNLAHPSLLIMDYVVLLVSAWKLNNELHRIHLSPYFSHIITCNYSFSDIYESGPYVSFKITWPRARYLFFRSSPYLILLIIFSVGTIHTDALSLGYLFFAMYFMSKREALFRRRNELWRWCRYFSFICIALRTLYQAPFVNFSNQFSTATSPASIFGLLKLSSGVETYLAHQINAFDLTIFGLLHLQTLWFTLTDFDIVVQVKEKLRFDAVLLAIKRYKDYRKKIEEKKSRMRKLVIYRKKQLRNLRVKRINLQRELKKRAQITGYAPDGATPAPGAFAQTPAPYYAQEQTTPRERGLGSQPPPFYTDYPDSPYKPATTTAQSSAASSSTNTPRLYDGDGGNMVVPPIFIDDVLEREKEKERKPKQKEELKSEGEGEIAVVEEGREIEMEREREREMAIIEEEEEEEHEVIDTVGDEEDEAFRFLQTKTWQLLPVSADDWKLKESDREGEEEEVKASKVEAVQSTTLSVMKLVKKNLLRILDAIISFLNDFTYKENNLYDNTHGVGCEIVCVLFLTVNVIDYHGRFNQLTHGIVGVISRNSHLMVYFLMLLNVIKEGTVLSLMYPISLFGYALLETPRPNKRYWRFLFLYTTLVITLKFVFQLSFFCTSLGDGGTRVFYSVAPHCDINGPRVTHPTFPELIGVRKFNTVFVIGASWDVLLLFALTVNQYMMKKNGLWDFVSWEEQEEEEGIEKMGFVGVDDEMVSVEESEEELGMEGKGDKDKKTKVTVELDEGEDEIIPHPSSKPSQVQTQTQAPTHSSSLSAPSTSTPSSFRTSRRSKLTPKKSNLRITKSGQVVDVRNRTYSGAQQPAFWKTQGEGTTTVLDAGDTSSSTYKSSGEELEEFHTYTTPIPTPPISARYDEMAVSQDDSAPIELEEADSEDQDILNRLNLSGSESDNEGDGEDREYDEETGIPIKEGSRKMNTMKVYLRRVRDAVFTLRGYYHYLLSEKKLGVDHYVIIFAIDFLSLLIVAFSPSQFIGEASNILEFVNQNRLPTMLVLILFAQFCLIIVERIIYLFKAVKAKLMLLYFLLIVYHIVLFVLIPQRQRKPFSELGMVEFFYVLKILYFIFSCLQVRHGFPWLAGRALTDVKVPILPHQIVYMVYRAIPFVYELRTIMDWAVTTTTLTLYEWLKFEDIYAELYIVKCRINHERTYDRIVGDPQESWYKWSAGGGLILLLIVVLWAPILPFTQGTNAGSANNVTHFTAHISLGGSVDMYNSFQEQGIVPAGEQFMSILKTYDNSNITSNTLSTLFNAEAPSPSLSTYQTIVNHCGPSPPPSRTHLLRTLADPNDTLSINVELRFTRLKPDTSKTIEWKESRALGENEKADLLRVLQRDHSGHHVGNGRNGKGGKKDGSGGKNRRKSPHLTNTFTIHKLIPRFFRLLTTTVKSAASLTETHSPFLMDVYFTLKTTESTFPTVDENGELRNVTTYSEYWEMKQQSELDEGFDGFNSTGVTLLVVSNPVPDWIPEALAAAGIIGIYTFFVLAVGRFLRLSLAGLSRKVAFEDMQNVDYIWEHCTDILLARQDGAFELEEELFRELLELYRSPERMILKSIPNNIRFRGRPLTKREIAAKEKERKEMEAMLKGKKKGQKTKTE